MTEGKHPFTFKYAEEGNPFQYLGSDGLPAAETYASYLETCEKFKAKARKYAKENLRLKNSPLQITKCGYESSEHFDEEVLLKREQNLAQYRKAFDITFGDVNFLTECFTGNSKRVRVIRELSHKRNEGFSVEFDKKRSCWFTRYCLLSRFIQAVRKTIYLKRMERALMSLRANKPDPEIEIKRLILSAGGVGHSIKDKFQSLLPEMQDYWSLE